METTRPLYQRPDSATQNIRTFRAWDAGTQFTIEETADGILLRPIGSFPQTDLDEVVGCVRSKREPKTVAQMRTAIEREIIRRRRGRRFSIRVKAYAD